MTYFIGFIILIIIVFIISREKSQAEKISDEEEEIRKKNDDYFNSLIEQESNLNAKEFLRKVKVMYDNDESYELLEVYSKIGVPEEIANSKDSNKIHNFLGFENEMTSDLFNTYIFEITQRNKILYGNLDTIEDAFDRYKIVLKDDEILYERFNSIYMLQEKTIRTNVTYSGMRWSSGPIKMGSLSYTSKDVKGLVVEDIGRLFVTNKRIIYVGKQNNNTQEITINSIIDYYLYKDGIMICRNNRKNIIFRESQYKNFGQPADDYVFILNDFPTQFIGYISRIANRTN